MKRLLTIISLFLFALISITYSPVVFAQGGNTEITEGKEYWVGVPHCRIKAGESIRNGEYPIMLWLSSKVDTRATVTADALGFIKTVEIKKNKTTIVELSDFLMNRESEVIEDLGIHVAAEHPVTCCVYISYKWSGEAFRCIPTEWLGKQYVATTMYLDKTDKYKPPQILIIATSDKTTVTYRPTAHTVKVNAGSSKTINLKKGQTFLIEGRIEGMETFAQDFITDLSGTYITASKPIAVISGHTKGAFPRFYMGTRSGWMEPDANFSRNMMTEMLWPIELLGTEYISAPLYYSDRPRGQTVVQDDWGDLIRFVAAYDDTEIYQMRQDGTGYKKIGRTIDRGEYHDIINMEDPALYRSTKPMLAAQYGKTWWLDDGMMFSNEKKKDQTLNPHRNGQGMLLILAPIDHWCSYAQFRSPYNIENFIYITFKSEARNHIRFDGIPITAKWGSNMRLIKGSDYEYITVEITAGDHWFEADSGYNFAAYAYGNWDYLKDGFAYGYPTGINFAVNCVDSIFILDSIYCGDVEGTAYVVPEDSSCANLFRITAEDLQNYVFDAEEFDNLEDKHASYWLKVQDYTQPAHGIVTAMARSGKTVTKEYYYWPEEIVADPDHIDFGVLTTGETVCRDIVLRNPNTDSIVVEVHDIYLMDQKPEFELKFTGLPATIPPGGSKTIQACATALEDTPLHVEDSVRVQLKCFEKTIAFLEVSTGEVEIVISDAEWHDRPINKEYPKTVTIKNEGSLDAEIYTVTWKDKTHFTRTENLENLFPLTIKPGQTHDFTVYYMPDVPGAFPQDVDTAYFTANTDVSKLYSVWQGNGIEAGPAIVGWDWLKRRVIDEFSINTLGITEYPAVVKISNTSQTGAKLDVIDVVIENEFNGVFRLDKTNMPTQLTAGQEVELDVFFAPDPNDGITEYYSNITFIADFDGNEVTATDYLKGIELQPHIDITGEDYGSAILLDDFKDGFGEIYSLILNDTSKMPLTLFSISINEEETPKAFEIDPAWLSGIAFPYEVAPGDSVKVPIRFTARHTGTHTAELVADHDRPDIYVEGELIGRGRTEGLSTTDYDFGAIFISLSTISHTVELVNTGSDPVTITDAIMTTGQDPNEFNLIKWFVESKPDEPYPQPPFQLPGNDKLICEVIFTPQLVRDYEAQIDYHTEDINGVANVLTSMLYGEGLELLTRVRIPDNYRANLQTASTKIDVKIDKVAEETKELEDGDVREFVCYVNYTSEGTFNVQDVFPLVEGVGDIYTNGTMTDGWTVDVAEVSKTTLKVKMSGDTPLKGSGTLFSFDMGVYLSDLDIIPLPVQLYFDNKPYIMIDSIPGKISVDPVCVNTIRLVELTNSGYSLSIPNPNPVSDRATIDYSLGLEGNTIIELYDSFGSKVATLLNQIQKPGKYELTIDINQLGIPSGVYQYRIRSGQWESGKQMVISK